MTKPKPALIIRAQTLPLKGIADLHRVFRVFCAILRAASVMADDMVKHAARELRLGNRRVRELGVRAGAWEIREGVDRGLGTGATDCPRPRFSDAWRTWANGCI